MLRKGHGYKNEYFWKNQQGEDSQCGNFGGSGACVNSSGRYYSCLDFVCGVNYRIFGADEGVRCESA